MAGRKKIGWCAAALAAAAAVPAAASPVPEPPQLWVMNADGTDQRVLVADTDWRPSPAWSPDGRSLAYTTSNGMIAIVDVDGQAPARAIATGDHAEWSPDGSLVAFVNSPQGNGGPGTLAVVRPDGSGLREVAGMAAPGPVEWSPDGTKIAYHRCDDSPCRHSLAVVAPDGTGDVVLAPSEFGSEPSWAPDSSAIAFSAGGDLWVVTLASTNVRNLTPGGDFGMRPRWGPGGRIAYIGDLGRTYLVDPDGTDRVLVHEGGLSDWSPDGTRLLVSYRGDILVTEPGTEGSPNLTNSESSEYGGLWSPDGARIAYHWERPSGPFPQRRERSISASLSDGVVLGRVSVVGDGPRTCASEVPLLLQRFGRRGWSTLDRGETTRKGRFEFDVGRREGLYRAKAPKTWARGLAFEPDECAPASSPPLRHRR
ncbi:MAG TPA: hypothetical protein VEV43_01470 [Actinomycetota bacterium]|nr:hypothetical protein [Actinomycetota bacterium]